MFPTRDDVVAHLDRHARKSGIELRLGTEVTRIDRQATRLATGNLDRRYQRAPGRRGHCGNQHTARIPEWPGADGFTGELLHSSGIPETRTPIRAATYWWSAPARRGWRSHTTLRPVVPARSWLAVRTPPNIMLRSLPGGLPGDLLSLPMYRLPGPRRRRDRPKGTARKSRRPQRVRAADPGRGGVLAGETGSSRCRRWSTWMSSTPSGMGRLRWSPTVHSFDRRQGRPRRRIAAGPERRRSGHRLPYVVWSRWSATSACWTRRVSPSLRGSAARCGRAAFHRLRRPGRR